MEKILRKWTVIGVFITFALAAGWHFLYNAVPCGLTAVISPVNESPWEHAKLFFVPALIGYTLLYFIVGKHYPNFIFAHSVSLLVMPAIMLLLYYGYHFFIESPVVDIANAFITISLGAYMAYRLTVSDKVFSSKLYHIAALLIVIFLFVLFAALTFVPPEWGPFLEA